MTKAAQDLMRYAKKIGFQCEYERSVLSVSEYVTVLDDRNSPLRALKIRFSDHECRPTYLKLRGECDLEIGNHQDADAVAAVPLVLVWLEKAGPIGTAEEIQERKSWW